jgi:hypothetical protein
MKHYADQVVSNLDQLVKLFGYLKPLMTGELIHITAKPWKPKRTNSQNNLMWMWNQEIADFCNEYGGMGEAQLTSDDIHEILVMDFWGKKSLVAPFSGEVIEIRHETKKFKIDQMTAHLQKMEYYAAQHHIPLTHPFDYKYAMDGEKPNQ